jgi:hypothetical protein
MMRPPQRGESTQHVRPPTTRTRCWEASRQSGHRAGLLMRARGVRSWLRGWRVPVAPWLTLTVTAPMRCSEPGRRRRRARRCVSRSPHWRRRLPRPSRKVRACTRGSPRKMGHWRRRPGSMPPGLRRLRPRSASRPSACAGRTTTEVAPRREVAWPSVVGDLAGVAGLIRRAAAGPGPVGSVLPGAWRVWFHLGCRERSPCALNSTDTTERGAGMLRVRLAQVCRVTGMRGRRAAWRGRRSGRPGWRPRCRHRRSGHRRSGCRTRR